MAIIQRYNVIRRFGVRPLIWALVLAGLITMPAAADAQQVTKPAAGQRATPLAAPARKARKPAPQYLRPESVQADVSSRRVAVTSSFAGRELVVFGAVDNSRQPNAASGYYDVVVVVEGATEHLVARQKSRIGGIWINSGSLSFKDVPSYYAISSTRPLDEIASDRILARLGIGFDNIPMRLVQQGKAALAKEKIITYRKAVVRLKQASQLYQEHQYGIAFTGSSLFRTSLKLPANVTIGPFATKVYLFREGELLGDYTAHLTLEREGVELLMYNFAFGSPFWYGIFAVIAAVLAGLAAAQVFGSKSH